MRWKWGGQPTVLTIRNNVSISRSKGFTLIEVMVAVLILAMVTVGGIAAYSKVRDRRAVQADAANVVEFLRLTQRKALAGEKPSDCGTQTLQGYEVEVETDNLTAAAVCGAVVTPEQTMNLLEATINSATTVEFKVLNGGSTLQNFYVYKGSNIYRVRVNESGAVDNPVKVGAIGG